MEFTETEIKMFERAVEIQKPMPCIEDGDYYWWSVTDKVQLSYTEYHGDYKVHHPEQWDWLRGNRIIWLPTQEQLQGMVQHEDLLNEIYWWTRDKGCVDWQTAYSKQFTSMRTLWLAFVMHEKYQKVWNGEIWIKEV